jgi:Uma2 family endonuclease
MVDINLKYELYEKEGVDYYIIVDPKETIAKVYRLKEGRYIKVCDAHEEQIDFDLRECVISFDFGKIW